MRSLNVGFIFVVCFLFTVMSTASANQDSTIKYTDLYYEVLECDTSCVEELSKCIRYFENINDTVWLARSLVAAAFHNGKDGNYGKAFTLLWEALVYAEQKNDVSLLYSVHTHLGRLYNIYNKGDVALVHENKVLEVAKSGYKQGILQGSSIVSAYFSLVHHFREKEEYDTALLYLDTCNWYADTLKYSYDERAYLISEKGNIRFLQGQFNEALAILKESERVFKRYSPAYLTIIYYYMGATYEAMEDWPNSELCFKKAIENVNIRKDHIDTKADCLSRLAYSLEQQNRYEEAYGILRQSKKLSDELFSTNGFQNAEVFDIRNNYIDEVEERDRIILERDKELILHKSKILRIRLVLIIFAALITIIVLFWYLQSVRKRFRLKQKQQAIQTNIEKEKNKVLVEVKNKELTSYTLRLIDKDSMINDMVASINKYAPKNDGLLKSIKQKTTGRLKLWEEFDKRFVDVNKGFYESLKSRFPELTPTELKHCALIKLNFSAKEMAQLLNISINGVNTSRYRIRKKLGLEREDNLANFIAGI